MSNRFGPIKTWSEIITSEEMNPSMRTGRHTSLRELERNQSGNGLDMEWNWTGMAKLSVS